MNRALYTTYSIQQNKVIPVPFSLEFYKSQRAKTLSDLDTLGQKSVSAGPFNKLTITVFEDNTRKC